VAQRPSTKQPQPAGSRYGTASRTGPAQLKARLQQQTRKLLSKHYRAKYGVK